MRQSRISTNRVILIAEAPDAGASWLANRTAECASLFRPAPWSGAILNGNPIDDLTGIDGWREKLKPEDQRRIRTMVRETSPFSPELET